MPAFDINFINPDSKEVHQLYEARIDEYIKNAERIYKWYKESKDSNEYKQAFENAEGNSSYQVVEGRAKWKTAGSSTERFKYVVYYKFDGSNLEIACRFTSKPWYVFWKQDNFTYYSKTVPLNDEELKEYIEERVFSSIAKNLQPTIVSWYIALRKIALVGLLSMLVYLALKS